MFINKPHLTVGYDQLTEVQQRALSNVVGTGRTLVRTGDQLSVTQLNELLARNAAGVGWNVTAKKSKKSKK